MDEHPYTHKRAACIRAGTVVSLSAVVLIALAATLSGCGPVTTPPAPQDTATPKPRVVVEAIEDTDVTDQSVLGQVEVDYPIYMSPGSSNTLILKIYILRQLASLDWVSVSRVTIPADVPPIVGKHGTFGATILVSDTVRVELSSPTFRVIPPEYPSRRHIDLDDYEVENVWAWSIVAPDTPGLHVLTAHIYLGEQATPSWFGSFEVDVREMTPVPETVQQPAPTLAPTPAPALSRLVTGVADHAAVLVIVLLIVAVGGAAVYLAWRHRQSGERWQQIPAGEEAHDVAAIRTLLEDAFTPEELRRFCMDRPRFRPLVRKFGPNDNLETMVARLIEYCDRRLLWEELLAEVGKENPEQYRRYEDERHG
ncbi:MAG: hypothetical protein JXA93_03790 [Anaerolineae bacterium]|nr:hypothetical protein [Anaerolineae bacterium]